MRIIPLIVFYIAACAAGIAETTPAFVGRSTRHVFERKSGAARSGVSEMPIDDGMIRMINKRNRRPSWGNRIDGFSRSGRNGGLERVERSPRRKKRAKSSDGEIAHRDNGEDPSPVRSPVWQVPVTAINSGPGTRPAIAEIAAVNNRAFEDLDRDRPVNGAALPVDGRTYSNSRGSFDTNEDSTFPKVTDPKSEIKLDPRSPASNNKISLSGMPADAVSPDSRISSSRGFQQYGRQEDPTNTYEEELSDDRLMDSNERFLLVPVSRNLYVLKNIRPRAGGIITPERYEPAGRDEANGTSTVLPFGTHVRHDAKDAGGAYLPGDDRSFGRNANYLYPTSRPGVTENPTGKPASYPDLLYPSVDSRTNLITTPETSDGRIVPLPPDYANVTLADVDSRGGIESYDAPASILTFPSTDSPDYDASSKENDGRSAKLDDETGPSRQDSGNYGDSLGYGGIEWTTADFRDTFGTLDDNAYTPASFETHPTGDEEVFDVSDNLGGDFEFSTGGNEDEPATDFVDNISTQYGAANEDKTLFASVAYSSVNDAENVSNRGDKDNREYGISIPERRMSTYSDDLDYENKSVDEVYMTAAPSSERPLKNARFDVENSRVLLTAIKPLSLELQKLLSAVKLVNRSLGDVQNRLCDKKNVKIERESEDGRAARLADGVDDSDLFAESFDRQSPDKRRVKTKERSVAVPDAKIRRKTHGLFLNRLMTTPFRKRASSISDAAMRGNFLEKRKSNEREFPEADDVGRRRSSRSRFNRNLKSSTKNHETRAEPIRRLIAGSRRTKRTTTSIVRSSRLTESNVSSGNNFAEREQNHRGNSQTGRSIILPHNATDIFARDNSARFSSDRRNPQRDAKRATSGFDEEKKIPPIDKQFHKEATAYLDVLRLLSKTEKSYVEYATDVQNITESLPPLSFTTTELSVLTLLPYFTEESTTIAERKEAEKTTASSLYEYTVADFGYSEDYDERNYTKVYGDHEYEDITPEISKMVSLTQSPAGASAITMPIISAIFYTTELTVLPIDEAAVLTEIVAEKMTTASPIAITAEVITGVSLAVPTIENFTTESAVLLTLFFEGATDITLKINIPAPTETSIEETPALIKTETVTTEEETVETTSTSLTTELMESSLVETNTSLYTFSTVSLFKTVGTELTIKATSPTPSTVPVSTTSMTKGLRTAISESTFGATSYNATAIASSPTVLERTETILNTPTEIAMTTLTPEDESPVTQIEKTITAEETATEIPATIETATLTEIATTTAATSTIVTEISTSIGATITELLTINKTLTATETPTSIETSTASEVSTIMETTAITETSTPEILTTVKIPFHSTEETTSAGTLTPIKTPTAIKTGTVLEISTEISTSVKITTITEVLTINETLTTAGTPTSIETSTSKVPITSTIPTTIETTTITETLIPIEILTTLKTPITEETTSVKTLTPTEILTQSTKIKTTIEISTSVEITAITEILTITETPTGTSAFSEIWITSGAPTITEPTITETTGISETSIPTEISATTKIPTTKKTTSLKTLTPIITETPSITEIPTTKKTTSLKTLTPIIAETPSITETQMITEIPTTTESSGTTEIPAISTTYITTKFFTTSESTTMFPKEFFPTSILTTSTANVTVETTESVLITSTPVTTTSIKPAISTLKLTTTTPLQTSIINTTLSETPCTAISSTFSTTTERSVKITSFKTVVPTTSLKITTTTPLLSVTSTMLSETPSTAFSAFLTEGTVASSIFTTSSLETPSTTAVLPISTTESTVETLLTASPLFIGTTAEATPFAIETTTLSTITEETSLSEKIVPVTPSTTIEEISTLSEVTLISTEPSTMSATETSGLVPTIAATTASPLEETATEITETSWVTTTERPEYATVLEAAVTVTLAPFSESILSILITSEMPATTPEVISVLPKTASEPFTRATTESPLATYTINGPVTSFFETTTQSAAPAATTEEVPEAETEYYVAKEPFYEEEYEEYEYDTEIPTGKWYYYDEYETTTMKRTTATRLAEKATSPFFVEGTTSSYEIETSEFMRYTTPSEIILTNITSTAATSGIPYTEEEVTSALETTASTVIENVTAKTEFTGASEKTESTTRLTFGSTEEYTLPSTTIFRIPTEPLEYLTIPPKQRFTRVRPNVTLPKFTSEKISEIELEKTTISEGVSTETEVTKLTSFFVSPALTTLTQKEVFQAHTAIMSTTSSETEETGYEVTTSAMTEEETVPRVTPFITSEAETEFISTAGKTVEREEEKEELLRRLDDLEEREREVAEREERLRDREKQWDIEKAKRRQMMQKAKAKSITVATGTIEGYVTTAFVTSLGTVNTENLTASEIEIASPGPEITAPSLAEITEATFGITEEITFVTERAAERTEEGTSAMYSIGETEEAVISYTTEKSIFLTYHTEEEAQITDYVTLTPYITTSIMDPYNVSLASIETVIPIEEMYTTNHVSLYSEPLFASPTSSITSATEKIITLPITTFGERFEEASVASTPSWYTTEETYTEEIYTDIYDESLFTLPTLEFISTTTSPILAVIMTEVRYDEEIERLKEELRKKEHELEEREEILLGREERLERDITEFEKYVEEFEKRKTLVTPSEKSTVLISSSTPAPPTEETTIRAQLTTPIKEVTEKNEYRTTAKTVSSQQTEMEEKKRTKQFPEETVAQVEEEIATKRVCLNVLENTTIPFDKRRRDIVTKKICLPYFPEKNEEEKSVSRLSRRLLTLQSTRKIRGSGRNVPLDFRCRRKETTRKIDNLQLSYHEWLSNETAKPLRHFQGFTRIYKEMSKFPKNVSTIIDTRRNATGVFRDKTSPYEQRALDYRENIFQPTVMSTLNSEEHRKRSAFFGYDLISAGKSNLPIDKKGNVRKRDVSSKENDARFWPRRSTVNTSSRRATSEEDGFYTVNVLHLNYNEDEQAHEVVSAKPDEDEPTAILSESNDDNYVIKFGEDKRITTPYYKIEEEDNLKEEGDEMAETEKKVEEDEDYVEDMMDNYMNYEEHETSTWRHDGKFLNGGKDKRMTENERKLLDRAWPTEKGTGYHLGGTKFWELDFVTEPSAVSRTTIDKGNIVNVSITRTTCFDVVLKNKENEVKSNMSHHKRDVYKNVFSIGKRNASLRNVTRRSVSRYKPKRPVGRKLKRDSQKSRGSNYTKRSFAAGRTAGLNDLRRAGDVGPITATSRKPRRQVVEQTNVASERRGKQSAKSRRNINSHSFRNADNCPANKRNKCRKATTVASSRIRESDGEKRGGQATRLDIVDRENKSTSATLHGRKAHNCFNCICDVASVVDGIRLLLSGASLPLDEIQALRCAVYKEIQDKVVISMDSDVGEAREFPQPHYNVESLKGQKYIRLEELEDNFKSDPELDSDRDVVSLPGLNLNLPCNENGDVTWLSSVGRPSYAWRRTDGLALLGSVAENGDLELRNVNAKDSGGYTCVMTYTSPDSEEPVRTVYEVNLQVVALPRYVVHGESRYRVRSCDERDLDVLVTYLPLKLNGVICEADVCSAYVLTPSCSRSQITVNILLVPSQIVKLMKIDPQRCNVFCLKAIQDKLSLTLSKNLRIFLGKTIIFRLPHYEQRLVPIAEGSSLARRKRGRPDASAFGRSSNVGLFSSCPAGYGLRGTRCVPCDMGTYSEDGVSYCKRCPPGTYQPNHGARVCRTCTNPMTKGCYNMLWNSFSAIMVTLASVGAVLSMCLLLLWLICCAKKKFCVKRMAGIVAQVDTFEPERRAEEQPLIKDTSENEDQQWDREYGVKRQKGKFYVNKRRRKQNESRKYDKTHAHEDEWGSHRIKHAPIIFPDSYQSHEDHHPKRSYRKGPRLPEYDFDT